MKRILLLLASWGLIFATSTAFASTKNLKPQLADRPCEPAPEGEYLNLCHRFNTEPGMAQCIDAGNGRYFDQCALNLCHRFTTEKGVIACMRAGRDKHYQEEEIALCNRATTERGAVDCLLVAGEQIEDDEDDSLREEVLRRVEDALFFLEHDRIRRAKRELEELEDWLRFQSAQ